MTADTKLELDWAKAKAHLDEMEQAYRDIGPVGVFALMNIMPLQDLYAKGERSQWLYDEIMRIS